MKIYQLVLIFAIGVFLYGDVMYEMTMTSESPMGNNEETMWRVFIKGDYSRTETIAKSSMAGEMNVITITRLDKGVIWTLDPKSEQYIETKLGLGNNLEYEEAEEIIPDIKIEKTQRTKKILKKDCEEVIISMKTKSDEGCLNFVQTMWVSKDIPGYKEINDFNKKLEEQSIASFTSGSMGGNKKFLKELQTKISKIEGFPLETTTDMSMGTEEMAFTIKTQTIITKINTAPIQQKVFEIPKGYTLKK